MLRRPGVLLVLIVPLAFAPGSWARPPSVVSASAALGRITALTPTQITVRGQWLPDWAPSNCTRTASSPDVTGFRVGDEVLLACEQGVLTRISSSSANRLGPLTPIPGILDSFDAGLPVSGPSPTVEQCASAWNASAPPAAQQALGTPTPLGAQVVTSRGSVLSNPRLSNPSHVIANGPSCVITFFLSGRIARAAIVSSWWKHGITGPGPAGRNPPPCESSLPQPTSPSRRAGHSARADRRRRFGLHPTSAEGACPNLGQGAGVANLPA